MQGTGFAYASYMPAMFDLVKSWHDSCKEKYMERLLYMQATYQVRLAQDLHGENFGMIVAISRTMPVVLASDLQGVRGPLMG